MVYVTQEQPGKNILSAQKFGKLASLLPEETQIIIDSDHVTDQLNRRLFNFTDNDYLLLIGDPIIIGLTIAIACKYNKGKAKLLKWDRQEQMYYEVQININN